MTMGLDPVFDCQLSEHVKDGVNSEAHFIQRRDNEEKVEELYKMQCEWFDEMKHKLSNTHNADQTPALHMSDVHLGMYKNINKTKLR